MRLPWVPLPCLPPLTRLSIAVAAVGACSSPQSRATSEAQRMTSAARSSDSCNALVNLTKPQRRSPTTVKAPSPPHPGSWRATKRFGGKEFSLLIPAVATMAFQKNDQQYWITGLPQCHYFCALTVRLSDKRAALGLDSFVAQRRFEDSANNDPDLTAYEPGPATRLTIGDAPALLLEANCGDCTGGTVFVARGARVGAIEYNVDDREGYQPALVCRLVAIAKTFRWSS